MNEPYRTLALLAIIALCGWTGYVFLEWLHAEEIAARTPQHRAGECLVRDDEREPWEPEIDWYVYKVGKKSYAMVRADRMPVKRYTPITVDTKSIRAIDLAFKQVPCPEKW